jgi:hypothetical protein
MRLYLDGKPTNSLADWAAASKLVDLAAARARLRPPARDGWGLSGAGTSPRQ